VTKLLGVRDAARLLGVHENTIRNWVKSGILRPTAVLAGSGYSRFAPEEIERVRRKMRPSS